MQINPQLKQVAEERFNTVFNDEDEITNAESIIEEYEDYVQFLENKIKDMKEDMNEDYERIPF